MVKRKKNPDLKQQLSFERILLESCRTKSFLNYIKCFEKLIQNNIIVHFKSLANYEYW